MSDLSSPHAPPRQRRFDWRRLWRRALFAGAALGVMLVAGGAWLWFATPSAAEIERLSTVAPSRVLSADGVLLDTIGERLHDPVTLEEVSPHVVAALLATEDRRFHEHNGLDVRRIGGALWASLRGDVQGASTITQQLARNMFPRQVGYQRSLLRKLREAVVALKIERAYDKRRILTMYLNQVPFLYNVTGIEMAAQTYFSKPASQLEKHEAALLVAMLKGPRHYDPVRWPERAKTRRDLVLALMARESAGNGGGLLRTAHAAAPDDAAARPLGLKLQRRDLEPVRAPHFVQQVRRELAAWAEANDLELARDGLTIHTTLDTRLQDFAEEAVQRQADFLQQMAARVWSAPRAKGVAAEVPFPALWRERPELLAELVRETPAYRAARAEGVPDAEALRRGAADRAELHKLMVQKTRLEAGFVAIDPKSGAVLAYVGSRDYAVDRFDHVATAKRQPGSTFKPFVYGAALRAGFSPSQQYLDAAPQIVLPDGRTWSPGDVGGASGQMISLRDGLARSKNTITAQVIQQLGVEPVVRYAREVGIERAELDPVPSLALGTSPVTLLEMTRAYATFASLGVKRDPVLVSHVVDRHGIEIARFGSKPSRVLDEDDALVLVDILRDAVDRGTGRMLRTKFGLEADIAGKTGTTQHNTDGWFIALRPSLVAGAWVGFNDQRVTMRTNTWGQGGHSALLIVGDFLKTASKAGRIEWRSRFPAPPKPPVEEPPAPLEGVPQVPSPFESAPSLESMIGTPELRRDPQTVAMAPSGPPHAEPPAGITWSRPLPPPRDLTLPTRDGMLPPRDLALPPRDAAVPRQIIVPEVRPAPPPRPPEPPPLSRERRDHDDEEDEGNDTFDPERDEDDEVPVIRAPRGREAGAR